MKPIIGVCANYSYDDSIGIKAHLGGRLQQWQLIADDYIRAIELGGGIPFIIPVLKDLENIKGVIDTIDGIVFTGGNDIDPQHYNDNLQPSTGELVPERDNQELELARQIINNTELPVLGICRGLQLINVACGGTLYQDISNQKIAHFAISAPKYHPVHLVKINKDSRLHRIIKQDTLPVNSYHHQALKRISKQFEVTAVSEDGIAEAIELKDNRFAIGIQWHPEMLVSHHRDHLRIFEAFVKECKNYRAKV